MCHRAEDRYKSETCSQKSCLYKSHPKMNVFNPSIINVLMFVIDPFPPLFFSLANTIEVK